jgi:hypothetical protein
MDAKKLAASKDEEAAETLKAAQELSASREKEAAEQLAVVKAEAAKQVAELEGSCRSRESKMADLVEENAALIEQVIYPPISGTHICQGRSSRSKIAAGSTHHQVAFSRC